MNKHNERAELIDEISVLADTLHLQPIGNDELVVLLRRAAALLSSDAQPTEWVGLTDEEMRDALRSCPHDTVENLRVRWLYAKDFARAIEAKLKEKNHGN